MTQAPLHGWTGEGSKASPTGDEFDMPPVEPVSNGGVPATRSAGGRDNTVSLASLSSGTCTTSVVLFFYILFC